MSKGSAADLSGKAAIVTGGGDGLGLATAELMAERGAKVLLVDLDQARLEAAVTRLTDAGAEVAAHVANVADEADTRAYVETALSRFGRIDALFNNAGILGAAAFTWDYPLDVFDSVLAVNVRGVFLGLKHVLPVMIAQGSGSIVNTASMGGARAIPGKAAYVASKHAVIGLTKTAAIEAGEAGVRVNAVLPGNIETKMAGSRSGDRAAYLDWLTSFVPQARLGQPWDIAAAVCFLFSDDARYITGMEMPVDGGILASAYGNAFKLRS